MKDEKTIVIYFSHKGENYKVGNVEKGNSAIVAQILKEKLCCESFEIEPVTPYPQNYDLCVKKAREDKQNNSRPPIVQDIDTEVYERVFFCFPNWCKDAPMPIYSFLDKHSWKGKKVFVCLTHEGSGFGSICSNIAQACKGASVEEGFSILGHIAQTDKEKTLQEIENYLRSCFEKTK